MLTFEQVNRQAAKMDIEFTKRVAPESKDNKRNFYKFATIGDSFLGRFVRTEEGTKSFNGEAPKPCTYYVFANKTGEYHIDPNASLRAGLEMDPQLVAGDICRITYTANKDTGKASPMKVFELEVGKVKAPTAQAVFPF